MHSRLLSCSSPQEQLLLQHFSPRVWPALRKAAIGWRLASQSD